MSVSVPIVDQAHLLGPKLFEGRELAKLLFFSLLLVTAARQKFLRVGQLHVFGCRLRERLGAGVEHQEVLTGSDAFLAKNFFNAIRNGRVSHHQEQRKAVIYLGVGAIDLATDPEKGCAIFHRSQNGSGGGDRLVFSAFGSSRRPRGQKDQSEGHDG